MSYQEQKTLVSVLAGILLLTAYCIYAFGRALPEMSAPDDLKFWATMMLIFIGIGIAATIVIQIVFHILFSITIAIGTQIRTGNCDDKEVEKKIKREMVEDEMDKLIGLKSMRISFVIVGIGFITGLLYLAFGFSAAVMINIIFIAFMVGAITEGITQLYFYRKGIRNG